MNLNSLGALQAEWQSVVRMRERIQNLIISTFAIDVKRSPVFGDILYNLPLRLAFGVLKQVLIQAKEEGQFTASRDQLSDLLESAKTSLPWIDWQFLREGVKQRDEVILGGKLLGDKQCLHYLAVIEAQLVSWGIITAAEPYFPPSFPRFS